ncbi:thioredoxin [Pleurocapsa sp. FMAR1]|uniref:thioredoxin n=1 Tax=Pleurocapsa sp. FMAR1 TaxID=3040204 RepID=UPI0029C8AC88|nr:thioredoxin [Pleurocapsa sp. FMAR1]
MAVKKQFSSFEDLLKGSELPVLVDFYATWCGPCQMMTPILEQVGANLRDRLQVVKIDTDKYPNLATKYQIEALPTLVLFKDGQPAERIEGVLQAQQLIQHLDTLV